MNHEVSESSHEGRLWHSFFNIGVGFGLFWKKDTFSTCYYYKPFKTCVYFKLIYWKNNKLILVWLMKKINYLIIIYIDSFYSQFESCMIYKNIINMFFSQRKQRNSQILFVYKRYYFQANSNPQLWLVDPWQHWS